MATRKELPDYLLAPSAETSRNPALGTFDAEPIYGQRRLRGGETNQVAGVGSFEDAAAGLQPSEYVVAGPQPDYTTEPRRQSDLAAFGFQPNAGAGFPQPQGAQGGQGAAGVLPQYQTGTQGGAQGPAEGQLNIPQYPNVPDVLSPELQPGSAGYNALSPSQRIAVDVARRQSIAAATSGAYAGMRARNQVGVGQARGVEAGRIAAQTGAQAAATGREALAPNELAQYRTELGLAPLQAQVAVSQNEARGKIGAAQEQAKAQRYGVDAETRRLNRKDDLAAKTATELAIGTAAAGRLAEETQQIRTGLANYILTPDELTADRASALGNLAAELGLGEEWQEAVSLATDADGNLDPKNSDLRKKLKDIAEGIALKYEGNGASQLMDEALDTLGISRPQAEAYAAGAEAGAKAGAAGAEAGAKAGAAVQAGATTMVEGVGEMEDLPERIVADEGIVGNFMQDAKDALAKFFTNRSTGAKTIGQNLRQITTVGARNTLINSVDERVFETMRELERMGREEGSTEAAKAYKTLATARRKTHNKLATLGDTALNNANDLQAEAKKIIDLIPPKGITYNVWKRLQAQQEQAAAQPDRPALEGELRPVDQLR